MLSANVLSFAALAVVASAAPAQQPANVVYEAPAFNDPFGIEANGGKVVAKQLIANQGRIYIGGKQDQPTNCSSTQTVHDFATFVRRDNKEVFLYTGGNPVQQVWTDSGYDGLTGYSTGSQTKPAASRLSPFEIDATTRVLTFGGVGAKACPEGEADKWGIWFTSSDRPGNLDGCFSVELKAYKTQYRDSCTYSHLPTCEEQPETCGSMKDPINN